MYIYIHINNAHIYIYIYPPTSSVVRVRLHLLAYNIQSLANSHPSKQGPEEAISPAIPGRQAAEIEESYPPGTKAAGMGARMLKSGNLIILSSSIGNLLRRNRLPQAATGRQPSGPRIQQISLNRCSRLHRSAKWLIWEPWLLQWSPHGTRAPQHAPKVVKALQNVTQIRVKSATSQAKRQASKHPSIQASGPRGRRQRR